MSKGSTNIRELHAEIKRYMSHYQQWVDSEHSTAILVKRLAFFKRLNDQFTKEIGDLTPEYDFESAEASLCRMLNRKDNKRSLAEKNEQFIDTYGGKAKVIRGKLTKTQQTFMGYLEKGHRLVMRDFSGYCFNGRLMRESTLNALIGTGELIEVKCKSRKGFLTEYIYHQKNRPTEMVNRDILSIEHLPKEIR